MVVDCATMGARACRVGLAHQHQSAPGKLTHFVLQPLLETVPAPGEHAPHRFLAQLPVVVQEPSGDPVAALNFSTFRCLC